MPFDLRTLLLFLAAATVLAILLSSFYSIGPTQVGLIRKRLGSNLPGDNPLAFRGEAGGPLGGVLALLMRQIDAGLEPKVATAPSAGPSSAVTHE